MSRRPQRRGASVRRRDSTAAGPRLWPTWRPGAYVLAHLRAFFYSLGRLAREPLASWLTVSIIGIAMALPVGLHLVLKNLDSLAANWQGVEQISLFLSPDFQLTELPELKRQLGIVIETDAVDYLSPQQALTEFRQYAGVDAAIDLLGENPLPAVLVVHSATDLPHDTVALNVLVERLSAIDAVEQVQLDMRWVQRLQAMNDLGRRITIVLTTLFGLAVLLAIGNSIRIEVQVHSDEIAVEKLVGATDAFIRRPFLYTGAWLGLLGGGVALMLVWVSGVYWHQPLAAVWRLSGSSLALQGLDFQMVEEIIAIAVLLGIGGGWLAVVRQLRRIEPA